MTADEMDVVIVMMAFGTIIFAQCVTDGIVRSGYGMNDSLFHKNLQRAIDRNAIEFFTGLLLNVAMGKGSGLFEEEVQYLFPAGCYTQLVAL